MERFRERSDGCAAFSRLRRDSVMEADASDSLEHALELGRDEELDAIERTWSKILMRMRELSLLYQNYSCYARVPIIPKISASLLKAFRHTHEMHHLSIVYIYSCVCI